MAISHYLDIDNYNHFYFKEIACFSVLIFFQQNILVGVVRMHLILHHL